MNSHLLKNLWDKTFRSGNPLYLYIGINVVLFIGTALWSIPLFLSGSGNDSVIIWIRDYFGLPASVSRLPYRFYTFITYQFFHDGLLHLLFNMLWLYWLGQIFLDFLKPRQFHFIYLIGGLAGGIVYLFAYNLFPVFANSVDSATVIGSSASVMAIIAATATLLPDYSIRLLLFGDVKLKYLALAYIALDLIGISSTNAGGSFAHLGGAILGFTYIKMLRGGKDWSKLFERKPRMKVVKNNRPNPAKVKNNVPNQQEIDAILDKISKTGYDKLSREEKETLFKASKD